MGLFTGTPPTYGVGVTAGTRPPMTGFARNMGDFLTSLIGRPMPSYPGSIDPGLSPTLQNAGVLAQTYATSGLPSAWGQAGNTLGRFQNVGFENPLARMGYAPGSGPMMGGFPNYFQIPPGQQMIGGNPYGNLVNKGMPMGQAPPQTGNWGGAAMPPGGGMDPWTMMDGGSPMVGGGPGPGMPNAPAGYMPGSRDPSSFAPVNMTNPLGEWGPGMMAGSEKDAGAGGAPPFMGNPLGQGNQVGRMGGAMMPGQATGGAGVGGGGGGMAGFSPGDLVAAIANMGGGNSAYWDPARMAAARPMGMGVSPGGGKALAPLGNATGRVGGAILKPASAGMQSSPRPTRHFGELTLGAPGVTQNRVRNANQVGGTGFAPPSTGQGMAKALFSRLAAAGKGF